jgi:alpha-mannosidase
MKAVLQHMLEEETLPNFKKQTIDIKLPLSYSFVEVEPQNLIISALKKCERRESLVIRIFNINDENMQGKVRVNISDNKFADAYKINANEERKEKLEIDKNGWINIEVQKKGLFSIELVKTSTNS